MNDWKFEKKRIQKKIENSKAKFKRENNKPNLYK